MTKLLLISGDPLATRSEISEMEIYKHLLDS